jgi:hypothetical protein
MIRNQRSLAIVLAALAMVAAPVVAAGQAVESAWAPAPLEIDGVAQEWAALNPIIEDESKVEYALQNDGKNLYIIMVFKSPTSKTTMDYTGMKIYFTTGGKKSKDYGILFQKKQYTADALIASLKKRGQSPSEAQIAEIRKKPTHVIYTEEVIKPKKAVVAADEAGLADPPMFRTLEKGRVSVCEFRIPLNRVSQIGGMNAGPGQQVQLGFEWGGMNNQIMRDMMAGRADRSVASDEGGVSSDRGFADESGDGSGGVGSRAGQIPTSEYNRDPRYKKHAFWIEAKLAGEAK